jgi:hypothetical protein
MRPINVAISPRKRRPLMQAWADYCVRDEQASNVVPIKA